MILDKIYNEIKNGYVDENTINDLLKNRNDMINFLLDGAESTFSYDDHKKINRKCLCWYVIGHWREYKNGNKIFIQGYWKGALRNAKKNYDDGRERIIDVS